LEEKNEEVRIFQAESFPYSWKFGANRFAEKCRFDSIREAIQNQKIKIRVFLELF